MPARKPSTLNKRHDTKADKVQRAAAETAMTPKTELPLKPPVVLNGHKAASATWKRVVGLYNELEGKIATSLDADLVAKYCLLEEEVLELAKMRMDVKKDWETQAKAAKRIKPNPENLKEWVAMWNIVNGLFQRFQGMDARLDGKRKLLLAISMSLYLTPRSRAGVEPPTKEDPTPKSEMEGLL
jgi:phage terminase small subunit